jgi:hypothetical protein
MPKFVLGCLVVLVVVAIGGGTAGYVLLIKPAYEFATDVGGFATEFAALNEQVRREPGFRPPADGAIDESQFLRFMAAQRDVRDGMAGSLSQLKDHWEAMQADIDRQDRDASMVELVSAYRDLGELILAAKSEQVQALNAHGFSLQEYLYVRNQTFFALGEQVAIASLGDQGGPQRVRPVPEDVVVMVRPHREELMEGYALAWFGL